MKESLFEDEKRLQPCNKIELQTRPMTQKTKSAWIGLLLTFLLIPLLPSMARAADETKEGEIGNYRKEGIDVVQRRVFRKSLRHEFSFDGGLNADNQFLMYEMADIRYTFHFREALAFEMAWTHMFHQNKAIINDLANIQCPAGVPAGSICSITMNPPPDPMKNIFFGNVVWSPIYGKFSIFSKKIYHFDLFLVAGAGYFQTEASHRFGFDVGAGSKVYLNNWCAVRIDFRNITVREGGQFKHIINNRFITAGVSFFLPTKPHD